MRLQTRRVFLAGAGIELFAAPAYADDFSYKDWRFNTDAVHGALPDAFVQSLKSQVDIVDSLNIKPEIKSFFHTVPLEIDLTSSGGAGAYRFKKHRMILSLQIDPPANPVFLHELLHAYHDLKLPDGVKNATVIRYYDQARTSGAFPPQAYMLKNELEFFAMCASVVLWGRAARFPYTRTDVREKLPDFYTWIVGEFGLIAA